MIVHLNLLSIIFFFICSKDAWEWANMLCFIQMYDFIATIQNYDNDFLEYSHARSECSKKIC